MQDDKKDIIKQNKGNESGDGFYGSTENKLLNDKCIKILAWILLTLGLCIIISTFYLAIIQNNSNNNTDYNNNNSIMDTNKDNNVNNNKDKYDESPNTDIDVNIISRGIDDQEDMIVNETLRGCYAVGCKIACMRSANLYEDVYNAITLNECNPTNTLLINHQKFEYGVLKNNWKQTTQSVQELIISRSNVTQIKNEAFNTPMFLRTFSLTLSKLHLENIESAALLGLNSLKYLTIDTEIACLDRSFFQPVQTTLTYLKLNAKFRPAKDQDIFGISHMEKLEYVDLSNNHFNGPLLRNTLSATPELKYLIMTNARVTAIAKDAFTHLIGKLRFINLSNNHLTTIEGGILEPLLLYDNLKFHLSMSGNKWSCGCSILPLKNLYEQYHDRFIDPLFCQMPYDFYGIYIDNLSIDEDNCTNDSLTTSLTTVVTANGEDTSKTSTIPISTSEPSREPHSEESETTDSSESDGSASSDSKIFQLRCLNLLEFGDSNEVAATSLEHYNAINYETTENPFESGKQGENVLSALSSTLNFDSTSSRSDVTLFQFEGPDFEFDLELFDNRTVRITFIDIQDYGAQPYIIYFTEQSDVSSPECAGVVNPLFVGPLEENSTYTFCLIVLNKMEISPFNCLPLHVPIKAKENVWISNDEKQFTIGMLCLIFILSTFFGAIVAYFGIKAHPDLLEGSKNVLVIKKSDQKCNVSTISDTEYLKKTSRDTQCSSNSSIHKPSLPETPMTGSLPTISMNVKDLERLASVKSSSSTCFEDAFVPMPSIQDDNYEMPKQQFETYGEYRIGNTYISTRPRSPPPLPKRNSNSLDEVNKSK